MLRRTLREVGPRPPLLVAATLLMLACSGRDPWQLEGAPKAPPDHQYRTGVEAGEDFWQWDCYEGQRVVIVKYSSACYAGTPKIYKGPCGKPLDFEEEFAKNERLDDLPEGSRWPGSDAGPPPRRDADAPPPRDADAGVSPPRDADADAGAGALPPRDAAAGANPSPSAGPSATTPAP